jgi:outer membrane protein assembly factor BamD
LQGKKRLSPLALLLVALLVWSLFLSGCAAFRRGEIVPTSPEHLYARAGQDYQKGRYQRAIDWFQRLVDLHPLSEVTPLARLGIADSHFSAGNYLEAERFYREFVFLYPQSEYVPYALYQQAMCHFHRMQAVDRDQTDTRRAKEQFETLMARFPESRFSLLAEKNLREVNKRLAERELNVGLFYFRRGNFLGAKNRFETILRDFPQAGFDLPATYYLEQTRQELARQGGKPSSPRKDQN